MGFLRILGNFPAPWIDLTNDGPMRWESRGAGVGGGEVGGGGCLVGKLGRKTVSLLLEEKQKAFRPGSLMMP